MTTFDDAVSAASAVWYGSDLADTIKYNGRSIPGHIEYVDGETGDPNRRVARCHVRKSDVPAPAYRDTVVGEDSVKWTVSSRVPVGQSDIDWVLEVETDKAIGFR